MSIYETVFIARQDLSEAQVGELSQALQKIITDDGGKILKTEYWGLRTFAYRINKARRGHYALIEFDVDGSAIAELERIMRLSEEVVRALTVKLDEPSKDASPIIAKKDRDDDEVPSQKYNKEAV